MEIAYWIEPNGNLYRVGDTPQATHARWIRTYRGVTVDTAEDDGWHRLVAARDAGELYTYGCVPFTVEQDAAVRCLAIEFGLVVRPWVR